MNSVHHSKVDNRLNILSFIGPAFVILPVLLIIIKESPFYIDVAATSFVGLLLCWRYQLKGLAIASLLLILVMGYDFVFERTPMTMWEIGLGVSFQLSFVLTSLASVELIETIRSASAGLVTELEEWKTKITTTLQSKQALILELEELKTKLLPLQDAIKERTEKAEMFERLLNMSRNELVEQTTKRHHFEEQYLTYKNALRRLEVDAKEERERYEALNLQHKEEIEKAHAETEMKQNQSLRLLDAELKVKSLEEDVAYQKAMTDEIKQQLTVTLAELEEKRNQSLRLLDAELKVKSLEEDVASQKAIADKIEQQLTITLKELEEKRDQALRLLDAELKIKDLEEERAARNQEIELQKARADESGSKVQALGEQLCELIDRLKNLQTEKDDLEKALAEALNEVPAAKEGKELKRVWGLHDQLRSQFLEKCQVLDQTRRELFHTQEQLSLQKQSFDEEAEEIYHQFEKHILALEQEIRFLENT